MAVSVPLAKYMAIKPPLYAKAFASTGNMCWQLWTTTFVYLLMDFPNMLLYRKVVNKQRKINTVFTIAEYATVKSHYKDATNFLEGQEDKDKVVCLLFCQAS